VTEPKWMMNLDRGDNRDDGHVSVREGWARSVHLRINSDYGEVWLTPDQADQLAKLLTVQAAVERARVPNDEE